MTTRRHRGAFAIGALLRGLRSKTIAPLATAILIFAACGSSTTNPLDPVGSVAAGAAPATAEAVATTAPTQVAGATEPVPNYEPPPSGVPSATETSGSGGGSTVNGAEPGPQAVVQSFYTWYIAQAQAGGAVNLRGRPDLTPAFVDWTEHYNDGQIFGADPVLCAQAIAESVTAGTAAISGARQP